MELIEFFYDKNIDPSVFCTLTFQNLVDIYKLAGKEVTIPDSRTSPMITKITPDDVVQKMFDFCTYRGGEQNSVEILENREAPWVTEHLDIMTTIIDSCLRDDAPISFNVETLYSAHPLAVERPYFDPAMWGFFLIFISPSRRKGALFFTDATF